MDEWMMDERGVRLTDQGLPSLVRGCERRPLRLFLLGGRERAVCLSGGVSICTYVHG